MTNAPLWALQQRAVEILRMAEWKSRPWGWHALQELAGWHCQEHARFASARWRLRWIESWVRGFCGEPDPYERGKGGNFVAPLRFAWRLGRDEYVELKAISSRPTAPVLEDA
jgi:hypothetical protein